MSSVFKNHTSFIDRSLQEIDALIARKRTELKRFDEVRKARSPGSFSIVPNESKSPSGQNVTEVRYSPSPTTAWWKSEEGQEKGTSTYDKENQNVNIQIKGTGLKSPLIHKPLGNISFRDFSPQQASIVQQQTVPFVPTTKATPTQEKAALSFEDIIDDKLVVDSITRALERIEQLEQDREDCAKYMQRLTQDKEELVLMLEAQRGVIDALSAKAQRLELDNSSHQHQLLKQKTLLDAQQLQQTQDEEKAKEEGNEQTAGVGVAARSQENNSSTANAFDSGHKSSSINTWSASSSGSGGRRRNARRVLSSSSQSSSPGYVAASGGNSISPTPFILGKFSPDMSISAGGETPDLPASVSHGKLRVGAEKATPSPSSIFIIRQQLPSPVLTISDIAANSVGRSDLHEQKESQFLAEHVAASSAGRAAAGWVEDDHFTIALYLFILVVLGYAALG